MKKIELILNKNIKTEKDLGVFAVSIVNEPAIDSNFIKLSKEEPGADEIKTFAFTNNEQKIVTGAALIPNKPIYRSKESMGNGEEAMIFFSADTIKNLSQLFLKNNYNNNVTLEHQEASSDMTLYESWIVSDTQKDKSYALGLELPVGTWCLSYKINSDPLWEDIKNKKFNGFSIEANMISKVVAELSADENNSSKTNNKSETKTVTKNDGEVDVEKEISTNVDLDKISLIDFLKNCIEIIGSEKNADTTTDNTTEKTNNNTTSKTNLSTNKPLTLDSKIELSIPKNLDKNAKVRNRGDVVVPAEEAKDHEDHFPINNADQARNALSRVAQLDSAPWFKGSLAELKTKVQNAVKKKYPSIKVSK